MWASTVRSPESGASAHTRSMSCAREYTRSGCASSVSSEQELVAGEVEPRLAIVDAGPVAIDAEQRDRLRRGGGAAPAGTASQDGPNPRHHFAQGEGFHDVVIGAEFQSEDAVDLLAASGQEDDRDVGAGQALPAEIESATVRQTHVEDHEVRRRGGECTAGIGGQYCMGDIEAFAAQCQGQRIGNRLFVLDQQYPWHPAFLVWWDIGHRAGCSWSASVPRVAPGRQPHNPGAGLLAMEHGQSLRPR